MNKYQNEDETLKDVDEVLAEAKKNRKPIINYLAGITKDDLEYVSPKNKKNKKHFYLGYTGRIVLSFVLLIFLVITCLYFTKNSIIFEKDVTINYSEKSNLDYKIKLKPNDYYESEYLDKNMNYVANLIDKVNLDFNYYFNSDKKLSGNYTYKIIGVLNIINSDNNQLFFTKDYTLLNDKKVDFSNELSFNIDEKIAIDYEYYNNLANGFKASYGVNTNSKLNVYLEISRDIDNSILDNNELDGINKMSISIPLSEKAVSIGLDYKDIDNKQSVIAFGNVRFEDIFGLLVSIESFIMSIVCLFYIAKTLSVLKVRENSYDKYRKKILREYDRLIVNTTSVPNLNEYEVVKVSNFNELIDAKENLHKPIYYCDVVPHHKCYFFIKNNKELLLLKLKESKFNEKKK